ncbi:1047_t:CDS:2, partial [Acaulospora colombiana]
HLTGLDIGYIGVSGSYPTPGDLPSNLWEICPGLTTLGINDFHISSGVELLGKQRNPYRLSSMELLNHGVFDSDFFDDSDLASIYRSLIKRWNITRIISAEPWNMVRDSRQYSKTNEMTMYRNNSEPMSLDNWVREPFDVLSLALIAQLKFAENLKGMPSSSAALSVYSSFSVRHVYSTYRDSLQRQPSMYHQLNPILDLAMSTGDSPSAIQLEAAPDRCINTSGSENEEPGSTSCLFLLFAVIKTSASIVKRDPVTWSLEQCRDVPQITSMHLDVAPLECGRISDATKGTINLQLARRPASQQPSRGALFLVGLSSVAVNGGSLAEEFGADWDLISWGVVNPQANSQYLPILGLDEQLADANQVLEGFYSTCAQVGPVKCPISAQNPSAEGIKTAVNQFLNSRYRDWTAEDGSLSYNMAVNSLILPAFYSPKNWDAVGYLLTLNGSSSSPPGLKRELERRQNTVSIPDVGYSWSDYSGLAAAYVWYLSASFY